MKDDSMSTIFAAEMKRWRQRLGLTQVEAAAKLNVKYSALRDWELGRRDPANIGPVRQVMKIALDEARDEARAAKAKAS